MALAERSGNHVSLKTMRIKTHIYKGKKKKDDPDLKISGVFIPGKGYSYYSCLLHNTLKMGKLEHKDHCGSILLAFFSYFLSLSYCFKLLLRKNKREQIIYSQHLLKEQ